MVKFLFTDSITWERAKSCGRCSDSTGSCLKGPNGPQFYFISFSPFPPSLLDFLFFLPECSMSTRPGGPWIHRSDGSRLAFSSSLSIDWIRFPSLVIATLLFSIFVFFSFFSNLIPTRKISFRSFAFLLPYLVTNSMRSKRNVRGRQFSPRRIRIKSKNSLKADWKWKPFCIYWFQFIWVYRHEMNDTGLDWSRRWKP